MPLHVASEPLPDRTGPPPRRGPSVDIDPTGVVSGKSPDRQRRQFLNFSFYKLDPVFRRLAAGEQGAAAREFIELVRSWEVSDDVILRTSVGRTGDLRFTDLDDAALTGAVVEDLDRILGVTGAPTEVRVGRWMRSLPQYAPGHLDRIAAAEAELAATPVRVAGMALRGVGIPACVRSAEEAVASLGISWPTRRGLAPA